MFKDKAEYDIEARFDGEVPEINDAALTDPEAAQYLQHLELMRQGAQDAALHQPIEDAQFSAFMSGVRDGIEMAEQTRYRGWMAWASLASLSAAALLIAFSFFWAVSPPQAAVNATVIESATTDIEGAVVDVYDSEYGVTTVWVNTTKDDVW